MHIITVIQSPVCDINSGIIAENDIEIHVLDKYSVNRQNFILML